MNNAPPRIWIWPEQSATGVINWLKGCYRAAPRRPLDSKDGPTGAEYAPAEWVADLAAALMPFADIGIGENPDYQPMIRMDRAAIVSARAALAKARGQA